MNMISLSYRCGKTEQFFVENMSYGALRVEIFLTEAMTYASHLFPPSHYIFSEGGRFTSSPSPL